MCINPLCSNQRCCSGNGSSACSGVVTGFASAITDTSATIANNQLMNICQPVLQVGIELASNSCFTASTFVNGLISSPFSVDLSGLQAGTNYYFRAFARTACQNFVGQTRCFSTTMTAAIVITGTASAITSTTATIVNNQYSNISGTIISVGVEYATNPSLTGSLVAAGTVQTPYSVGLTDLLPSTTYYYRAIVQSSSGTSVGTLRSFTTSATGMVVTGTAGSITTASAVVDGNSYSNIPGTITSVGVEYATNPSFIGSLTAAGVIQTPYSVGLTGLTAATTYYYRAVVQSSNGTFRGQPKSFSTLTGSTVLSGTAGSITNTTATISNNQYANVPGTITSVGVQYATNPAFIGSLTADGTIGSPFSVGLTGLTPATTYYFRSIIQSSSGIFTGETKNFLTLT